MEIGKILKAILASIGDIASISWLLVLLGVIPEPIFHGAEFLATYYPYFVLSALAMFFSFTLWLGYQLGLYKERRKKGRSSLYIGAALKEGRDYRITGQVRSKDEQHESSNEKSS